MDTEKLIQKYIKPDTLAYNILIIHSRAVTNKALEISKKIKDEKVDLNFIKEAGMLHDIGIIKVKAENIGCFGDSPYIAHGILGSEILQNEGLPKHALVCERHTGVGITKQEVIDNELPLPARDLVPISNEEIIICLADKFFSKDMSGSIKENSIENIIKQLSKFSQKKVDIFNEWLKRYY